MGVFGPGCVGGGGPHHLDQMLAMPLPSGLLATGTEVPHLGWPLTIS